MSVMDPGLREELLAMAAADQEPANDWTAIHAPAGHVRAGIDRG